MIKEMMLWKIILSETGISDVVKETVTVHEDIDEIDLVKLNDPVQVSARNMLIKSYKNSFVVRKRIQVTNRSVKLLHRKFVMFEKLFAENQSREKDV